MQPTQADGVIGFYVRKANVYEQTSVATPGLSQFGLAYFIARANGDAVRIAATTLSTPSLIFPIVALEGKSSGAEFSLPGDSDTINTLMPAGLYSFTFSDGTIAPLNFAAGSYPTHIPHVSNWVAAQSVEPAAAFAVTFDAFMDAEANDTIELEISDSEQPVAFFESATSASSITIPANTLSSGASYDAHLRFIHNVDSNAVSVPSVTGTAGYVNDTKFSISTKGSSGGGGEDVTPPFVVATTPANHQTAVNVNTTLSLIFSEPMAKQQLIEWVGVDPSKFSYSWSEDGKMLTAIYAGELPANATITYDLQAGPEGFKDLAGNPLVTPAQASFTTGSGGNMGGTDNSCTSTNIRPVGSGSAFVLKSLRFHQKADSLPNPGPDSPAMAFASYDAAHFQTVTSVRITNPNNGDVALSNFFGHFFATQPFSSGADLDAVFPAGAYTILADGAGSAIVTLPKIGAIPVPSFSNFEMLRNFDPREDFTLTFSPFTGVEETDGIAIEIIGQDRHFYAPDYCLNRPLANTASSTVIPANTFRAGDELQGLIRFSRLSVNSNSIPNTFLQAGVTVSTSFAFTDSGSLGSSLQWSAPAVNADGTITFRASTPVGTTVSIEKSADLTIPFTTVTWANGTISYTFDPKSGRSTFFRGKSQ